ncbi:MAG: transporter [Planctomycetes bacterium]|nr:transporter [Planctomycetota bacterium]
MKTKFGWMAMAMLGLAAATASAEWERTVNAWDTRLPDQGRVQASIWGSYWEWEAGRADGYSTEGRLYVNYGIANNWALCVTPSVVSWDVDGGDSESGIGDTALLSIYRFMEEADAGFDLAVKGSVSLPTGDDDKGLGSGSVEPGLALLAAKTIGPFVAVANAGGDWILDTDRGEEDYVLYGVLEGLYPLSEQATLSASCSAATARWDGEDDDIDLGIGGRVTPIPEMFLAGAFYYSKRPREYPLTSLSRS